MMFPQVEQQLQVLQYYDLSRTEQALSTTQRYRKLTLSLLLRHHSLDFILDLVGGTEKS